MKYYYENQRKEVLVHNKERSTMELDNFSKKDILLSAIKSELDSKEIYSILADKIDNVIISDKLSFLAEEEEKHKQFVEFLFQNEYPDEKMKIPEISPVPLPEVVVKDKDFPLEEIVRILKEAKKAEKAASDFYSSFAKYFKANSKQRNMLEYFSQMELGHYNLIDIELQNMERLEAMEDSWSDLMNIGP